MVLAGDLVPAGTTLVTPDLAYTPGISNSNCFDGQMRAYKVTGGPLTQQWRYLNAKP